MCATTGFAIAMALKAAETRLAPSAIARIIEKQARFIVYGTFWNVCHCARPKEM